MPTLSEASIAELLTPFYPAPPARLLGQLSAYLDLLLKWNARTNLSAIREPEAIVTRHFGESLFLASRLPSARTLLDLGSGAGFPGLPCALARPELMVTLAESQNKKASFLREVARTLAVDVEIWDKRAELLPDDRRFDVVTLRAVDNPEAARMYSPSPPGSRRRRRRIDRECGFCGQFSTNPQKRREIPHFLRVENVPRGTFALRLKDETESTAL